MCANVGALAEETPLKFEILTTEPASIEAAMQSTAWQSGEGVAQLGYVEKDVWLRYPIPQVNTGFRAFTINNPWLFKFDLYVVDHDGSLTKHELGSVRPVKNRPLVTSNFAVPLMPTSSEVYIRDHGESAANYPVKVLTATEFSNFNAALNLYHGFYYGLILIMVLYNLALFAGSRDQAYLYYSLYAFSLMTFLATADGSGAMFIWSDFPSLQYVLTAVGWGLGLIFLLEFAQKFLTLARTRLAYRVMQGFVFLTMLINAFNPGDANYEWQTVVTYVVLAVLMFGSAQPAFAGSPQACIFLFAVGAFVAGGLIHASMLLGFLEASVLTHHAVHIGSVIELTILSGALVFRVRQSETKRFEALQQSRELIRRNRELNTARALAEEHRQLQKSLQQAQKLKTIGQLAGGFAHDFNNILASVLGFAELAQTPTVQSDRAKLTRYLDEIVRSGHRGANLVRQLLVYSRSTPAEPRELDICSTLLECTNFVRGSLPATVAITTETPDRPIRLMSDPEQVQQMLVNICLNSAEATNNRGSIHINLSERAVSDLTCSSCLKKFSGEFVAISIEDDGPGISGNASQLFTPFETTKDVGQGTGLGLSVVHGISHEHHGHVHGGNRAEGGARFTVYLPLSQPELAANTIRERSRILIIEDDPSVATYLAALLGDAHFDTTVQKRPAEALQTFVSEPDAYDLVITDYLMPQGTGLELAEDLHALRPDLPVLLMTGDTTNVHRTELEHAGIRGVFPKPLNSEQLLAKIHALLVA
ncbi:MAG: response regulator [Pseudomonadales bacterium]|nr:response regulator [Pseudomonadales bacterium]